MNNLIEIRLSPKGKNSWIDFLIGQNSVVGIRGNEIADGLARGCTVLMFFGPEPALGVSRRDLQKRLGRWLVSQHGAQLARSWWHRKAGSRFSFCNRVTVLIYISKNQLFALKYTSKHSLVKIISTPTCFGLTRPSSGRCHAWLLSYLEQITFLLRSLCSSTHLDQVMCPFRCWRVCCLQDRICFLRTWE